MLSTIPLIVMLTIMLTVLLAMVLTIPQGMLLTTLLTIPQKNPSKKQTRKTVPRRRVYPRCMPWHFYFFYTRARWVFVRLFVRLFACLLSVLFGRINNSYFYSAVILNPTFLLQSAMGETAVGADMPDSRWRDALVRHLAVCRHTCTYMSIHMPLQCPYTRLCTCL